MSRSQFLVRQGIYDSVTPTELYKLLNAYQKHYRLHTQYAALTHLLQKPNLMERIPADRRAGATVNTDSEQEHSERIIYGFVSEYPEYELA